jgi:hypothetical protein
LRVKLGVALTVLLAVVTALTGCGGSKKNCPGGITKPLVGIVRAKAQVTSNCFTVKIQLDSSGETETFRVSRWTHSHVVIGQRAWLKPEDIG